MSYAAKQRATTPLERPVRREAQRMWGRQQRLLLDRMERFRPRFAEALREATIGPHEFETVWTSVADATSGPLADTLDDLAPQAAERGWDAAARDVRLGVAFSLANPRAVEFLRNFGARRVTAINAATRREMQGLLVTAAEEGWAYNRLAGEIGERFEGFRTPQPQRHIRDRAELVAVTEIGDAFEHGQQMVVDDLTDAGVATEKAWLTAGDDRVDADCAENEAAGWIPSGDDFPTGVSRPLQHPACRCAMQVRVAEGSRIPVDMAA